MKTAKDKKIKSKAEKKNRQRKGIERGARKSEREQDRKGIEKRETNHREWAAFSGV